MNLRDKIQIINRKCLIDERGKFLKVIDGKENLLPDYTGEFYLTTAYPGKSRGSHYHLSANEWFTLMKGKCILKIVDVGSKEQLEIAMEATQPFTIFVPANVAHVFVNTGEEEFILAAYSDKIYDPLDTIPYNFL